MYEHGRHNSGNDDHGAANTNANLCVLDLSKNKITDSSVPPLADTLRGRTAA